MIRTTMHEVETSLSTIDSSSSSAIELVNSIPTDLSIICPLVNDTAFEALLGVDIRDIIGTIVEQQDRLREEVESRLSIGQSFVNGIEEGLSSLEISIDKSEEYVWIVPGLLFGICVLVIASILGVILAWKEKSGVGLQRVMSYVVLPLLILAAILCWLMVVLSSLSTMIGTGTLLTILTNIMIHVFAAVPFLSDVMRIIILLYSRLFFEFVTNLLLIIRCMFVEFLQWITRSDNTRNSLGCWARNGRHDVSTCIHQYQSVQRP